MRLREVLHIRKLLSQEVLNFWLFMPLLYLKKSLLPSILVRQLLLQFKASFKHDVYEFDLVSLSKNYFFIDVFDGLHVPYLLQDSVPGKVFENRDAL